MEESNTTLLLKQLTLHSIPLDISAYPEDPLVKATLTSERAIVESQSRLKQPRLENLAKQDFATRDTIAANLSDIGTSQTEEPISIQSNINNSHASPDDMGLPAASNNILYCFDTSSSKMNDDSDSGTRDQPSKDCDGESCSPASPSYLPLPAQLSSNTGNEFPNDRVQVSHLGTPTTVSTIESSDDMSIDCLIDPPAFERLSWNLDNIPSTSLLNPNPRLSMHLHRRSNSWDEDNLFLNPSFGQNFVDYEYPTSKLLVPQSQYGRSNIERSAVHTVSSQARVASFHRASNISGNNVQYQSRGTEFNHEECQGFNGQFNQQLYQPIRTSQHVGNAQRNPVSGSPSTSQANRPNTRPPLTRPTLHLPLASSASRSSSEVLKTLLRKKACLYEPYTSRAIALITWLVGRELALEYGYFSRQQLQLGVHACVSSKIDGGFITRTKVNRCMQIILNSCFHYIIPRPDGSEENGNNFRELFAKTTRDEQYLLSGLPPPWNDVKVEKSVVLQSSSNEECKKGVSSPPHSPRLASTDVSFQEMESEDHAAKRSVLLSFNENVRCAEDAFRCHNEFIRDAANGARLQLTFKEWQNFYGDDTRSMCKWNGMSKAKNDKSQNSDMFGCMDSKELGVFRTTWCAKRYDHDHELCGFAHVEVNEGWLRRNPSVYKYSYEMCPDILRVVNHNSGSTQFMINQCQHGENCNRAHSSEEVLYHPLKYKKTVCNASVGIHGCTMGDACHNLHPMDSRHSIRSQTADNSNHQRQSAPRGGNQGNNAVRSNNKVPPSGSPMLYVNPAPSSSFERHLQMPGLQKLFRQHCSIIKAQMNSPPGSFSRYRLFEDEIYVPSDLIKSQYPVHL